MPQLLEGDSGPTLLSENPLSTFSFIQAPTASNSDSEFLSGPWTGHLLDDARVPLYAMAIEFRQSAESDSVAMGTIDFYCGTVTFSSTLQHTNLADSQGEQSESERASPESGANCEDCKNEELSQINPLVLEFETSILPGYDFGYYFRFSPANASKSQESRHWKGEWRYTQSHGWSTLYPCEMFRMPPEGLRFLPIAGWEV